MANYQKYLAPCRYYSIPPDFHVSTLFPNTESHTHRQKVCKHYNMYKWIVISLRTPLNFRCNLHGHKILKCLSMYLRERAFGIYICNVYITITYSTSQQIAFLYRNMYEAIFASQRYIIGLHHEKHLKSFCQLCTQNEKRAMNKELKGQF